MTMKTNITCLGIALVAVALVGVAGTASAEVLEVAPTAATVYVAQGTGVTTAVLRFDLSGLAEGEGRVIDEALLDWPLTGLSGESRYSIEAFPVTTAWTPEGVSATAPPSIGEAVAADWDIEPGEISGEGGALVRLNLKGLVDAWAGEGTNCGIVILLPGLSANGIMSQLQEAKLTVRYGFREE
jgi:hypothetical protein